MATATTSVPPALHKPFLTPAEISDLLSIDTNKVIRWIHSAQLPAANVAVNSGGRPRWRIRREDFDAFLKSRQLTPSAAVPRRRRKSSPRYY